MLRFFKECKSSKLEGDVIKIIHGLIENKYNVGNINRSKKPILKIQNSIEAVIQPIEYKQLTKQQRNQLITIITRALL